MPSLYELTRNEIELMEMLASGEVDEQCVKDTVEAMGTPEKLEGCIKYIRNLEVEAEAYKKEKASFFEKQQQTENKIEHLKKSLLDYMIRTQKSNVQTELFKISVINHNTTIYDENKIPEEFFEKIPKLNKSAIKNALAEGVNIDGVTVENRPYIKIK